jgi:hypothetical protein
LVAFCQHRRRGDPDRSPAPVGRGARRPPLGFIRFRQLLENVLGRIRAAKELLHIEGWLSRVDEDRLSRQRLLPGRGSAPRTPGPPRPSLFMRLSLRCMPPLPSRV